MVVQIGVALNYRILIDTTSMKKFKLNDRVRRVPYTIKVVSNSDRSWGEDTGPDGTAPRSVVAEVSGCQGTVKAIREETTNNSPEARERSVMIEVLWDNGSRSVHGSAGLDLV